MVKIEYPNSPFSITERDGKPSIFDLIRKRWLTLTPEEWVRQNFLQYLVENKQYPPSLIGVEKELQLNEIKKRCDIVVYRNGAPWMLIECKEPSVMLSTATIDQLLRYNIALPVPYLVITNGTHCFAWERNGTTLIELLELPSWND